MASDSRTQAMQAYKAVDVDTRVLTASPQQLILLLLDGALAALAQAKAHLVGRNIAAKGAAIGQAIAIINEGLKGSLDEKTGGALAQDLKALYEYMGLRLLSANLKNDPDIIDEVTRLLQEIANAWRDITQASASVSSAHPAAAALAGAYAQPDRTPPPAPRAAMSYGKV